MRSRRWVWVGLFILLIVILGSVAAGWNVVLLHDYLRILELANALSMKDRVQLPWITLVVGTVAFMVALGGIIAFFIKLDREMKLNQHQSEFLAAVSHELKTPIATIELTSDLLKNMDASLSDDEPQSAQDKQHKKEETEKLWDSHDHELQRLQEEVSTLLEAARWHARAAKPEKVPFNLESFLDRSLPKWEKYVGTQIHLTRSGDALDFQILADEKTLCLIIENLLSNARKFSPKEIAVPEIHMKTQVGSGQWKILIQDFGMGFDPKDEKRIFKRFYRSRSEAPLAIPGTGLGLYIAKTASKSMSLVLRGESQGLGRGATFTLQGKVSRRSGNFA